MKPKPTKSSIHITRGGRSTTFRGGAARSVFESMTGAKLPTHREMTDAEVREKVVSDGWDKDFAEKVIADRKTL